MDYSMWDTIKCKACTEMLLSLAVLQERVFQAWFMQNPAFIRRVACAIWPGLERCVAAQGCHVEL